MNTELARKLIKKAKSYKGIPYRFGAEPSLSKEPPSALDCLELIERIFKLTPGAPVLPDGSKNQAASKKTRRISTTKALSTPAALLFISNTGKPSGVHHVGLSVGDGTTIEANGYYGKVVHRKPRANYYTFGMIVKGVHY